MKKLVATVAATGLLLVGSASAASAETLYRSGANKVTITAQGAPAGAQVTKAKVTVKKGKKTVARNKNFYKAKKGTYVVTSKITYRPLVWREVPHEVVDAACEVQYKEIVDVNTDDVDYTDEGLTVIAGSATVLYSGTCYDTVYINGQPTDLEWDTDWVSEEDVYFEADFENLTEAEVDAIATDSTGFDLGDYVRVAGYEMETMPVHQDFGAKTTITTKRTVVVV